MYARISQLNNLPIISLQTAEAVGFTRSPILEPATLEIVAFNCGALNRSRHPLILMTADIRQLAPDCIVIDTEEELTEPGDVVRLQPLIKKSYSPIGKSVVTQARQRRGLQHQFGIEPSTKAVCQAVHPTSLDRYKPSNRPHPDHGCHTFTDHCPRHYCKEPSNPSRPSTRNTTLIWNSPYVRLASD
jgi:hypothetical protein